MSIASPNVIPMEQHLTVIHQVVQSANPPSYEEEIHLPSYEEAILDRPPAFPVDVLKYEQGIKDMCSMADLEVERALRMPASVLDLDINVEQNLIYACATLPVTPENFAPYLGKHMVYLYLRLLEWMRTMRGTEDIEWGVERMPMHRATRIQLKRIGRK
ncbi:hypothetical protein BcDW1_4411 [Botrytis cinerea BcDW1]|uniref:Uncharacterized protein n=1 Tax=Botryotinia fuckeliana (strain BcDW1) TaxID=1290391 RepID=M7U0B1_BOTF1|nr:hypothetical protein BcDW1_4411 [Botrytis cinerea BcDW1]